MATVIRVMAGRGEAATGALADLLGAGVLFAAIAALFALV